MLPELQELVVPEEMVAPEEMVVQEELVDLEIQVVVAAAEAVVVVPVVRRMEQGKQILMQELQEILHQ